MSARFFKNRALFLMACAIFLNFDVLGCSCTLPTICQAYSRAESVFIGKLISIEDVPNSPVKTIIGTFQVEETFKGSTKPVERIKFVVFDCDEISFKSGDRYFVYNDPSNERGQFCKRTQTVFRSAGEIAYARGISKGKPAYWINGHISLEDGPLSAVVVKVRHGKEETKLALDNDGFFAYRAEKVGEYEIRIAFPFAVDATVKDLNVWNFTTSDQIIYTLEFAANECDYVEINAQKHGPAPVSLLKSNGLLPNVAQLLFY